jgi:exosortase
MKASRQLLQRVRKSGFTLVAISLIVLTVLILYWQDLSVLANEALQNEATNHIILVPFLASFLIYRKRKLSRASLDLEKLKRKNNLVSFSEITGIALCLSAFLLYWYGTYTFYPIEFHVASLTLFVIGITLTLFNVKTLTALIFPILFLIFLAPPPSAITLDAGAILGNFDAQASYTLLKTLGMPVALSSEYGPPTIVLNSSSQPSMEFSVDQACSGIYSLIAFAMFAAFLILIVRGPIAKKILLVPIGFLMLPILNIIRISLIVLIAHQFGQPIAMTFFHTFSGWLVLSAGMLLLLLIAEKILHLKIYEAKSKATSCNACDDSSKKNQVFCPDCGKILENHQAKLDKKFWLKISSLLLVTIVVALSLQAPVFAFAEKLTLTNADPQASAEVFPEFPGYRLIYLYRDTYFERISRTDASLTYAYFPQNVSNPTIFVLIGVGSSISNLHNWEVCLVSWRTAQGMTPVVNVFDSRDIQIMENPPIMARYLVFQYPPDHDTLANYTQVTLYWYQKALFKTGLTIESKYTRISLLILTGNQNDYPKQEQTLLSMSQQIAAHWEPLKAQSLVSLGIPTMQILLVSTTVFAIAMQTTQYASEQRKKTTNLQIFERYGSQEEKRLYQTIKDLRQKTKETTTRNIESAFKEEPANSPNRYDLLGSLENLQKNGIIQLDVINVLDQPRLVWKP